METKQSWMEYDAQCIAEAARVNRERSSLDKILFRNKRTGVDIAHDDAIEEDTRFDQVKAEEDRKRKKEQEKKQAELKAEKDRLEREEQKKNRDKKLLDTVLGWDTGRTPEKTGIFDGDYHKLETLMLHVLDLAGTRPVPASFVDSWSEVYVAKGRLRDLHSLCHLFEDYGRCHGNSLLKDPAHHARAAALARKAVTDVILGRYPSEYISRVLCPMIKCALDRTNDQNLDQPYVLHLGIEPEQARGLSPTSDGKHLEKLMQYFVSSRTPGEFLRNCIENNVELPYRLFEDISAMPRLIAVAEGYVGKETVMNYLGSVYGPGVRDAFEKDGVLEQKLSASASGSQLPVEAGLFVDIEGTLIVDGKLNQAVVNYVGRRAREGVRVTLFTGGSPDRLTGVLKELGFNKHLPVQSKAEYFGKNLAELVDDTPPEFQGFYTDRWTTPRGLS